MPSPLTLQITQSLLDRAVALHLENRLPEALAGYDGVLRVDSENIHALANSGGALLSLGRPEDALARLEFALGVDPQFVGALANLSSTLFSMGRFEEAVDYGRRAVKADPSNLSAHLNLGSALLEVGRPAEALAYAETAERLDPRSAAARYNQSLPLLQLGQWARAWPLYEARLQGGCPTIHPPTFDQPRWNGEEIKGRRILLYGEQGLGDTIQFCRYAPLVAERGAEVILHVPAPLKRLVGTLAGVSRVVVDGDPEVDFDVHCPLPSLPGLFGTSMKTVPSPEGYLRADSSLVGAWGERLERASAPRVGLVWAGNTEHHNDRRRSIALAEFLARLPDGLSYVSLQKELRPGDVEALAADGRILDLSTGLGDFTDTAALCELMDVVVTVDTSVAHLSAALGRPTWILLPYAADWRWMIDRGDTPWYRSMKIFRQRQAGAWGEVIARVVAELHVLG